MTGAIGLKHNNTTRLILLALLGLAAWTLFWLGFRPGAQVEHAYNGKVERTAWVWLDALTPSSAGRFDGILRVPASRSVWIDNADGAQITFTVDGAALYRGSTSAAVELPSGKAAVQFTLEYERQGDVPPQSTIGLYEEIAPGARVLIPAWNYAPAASSDDTLAYLCRSAFGVLLAVLLIGLLTRVRIPRRAALLLTALFALALAVQLIVLSQKFSSSPGLWTMAQIWDNYVEMGRDWLAGRVAVGGNAYQQGMFIYLGVLQYLIGPALPALYVLHALFGSLVPVIVALTGWQLFERNTGLLAGLLTALYAPLIHYQQTLQDTAPVILLVSLALLALALYYRRGGAWLIVAGALIGLGAAFRSTILILLLTVFVAVLLRERRLVPRAASVILAGVAALLCLLPITAANLTAGVPTLTANLMDYQLFRSNNLNSTGLNTFDTQSEQLAKLRGDTWRDALLNEIRRQPLHVVELTARRLALFWDPVEHSDSGMIDYRTTGLEASPLLNALALGGAVNARLLLGLALVSLSVALVAPARRGAILLLSAALVAYMLSLIGFYVIGRVRISISVIELLLAAVALRQALLSLRARQRRTLTMLAAAACAAWGIGAGMGYVVEHFPRPNFITAVPDDLAGGQATFGGTIRLLGYAYYDSDYQPDGYLALEVYWQALRPPEQDYVLSVRFVNHLTGAVAAAPNVTLGTAGVPAVTSSQWSADSRFYERYLLRLPAQAAAYDLYVGLYDPAAGQLLPVSDTAQPVAGDHVRLTGASAGLIDADREQAAAADALATWGAALQLRAATCRSGQPTTISLTWTTLAERPPDAMTLFAHLWQGETLVGQRDAAPLDDAALDALPAGSSFTTTWAIASTAVPDRLQIGFYTAEGQRWPVTSARLPAEDNVLEIACSP